MTETRLLARLLATARTVTAPGAVAPLRPLHGDDADAAVRAKVTAQLADGTFRVLIDGVEHRVELPGHVRPGDVVAMRLVPRHGAAPAPQPGADGGELSPTGRLIAALLREAPSAPSQARPVLDAPPATPTDLAAPLARALERSGMFYESHQARWIEGDYPLERLLEEPQAALLPRARSSDAEEAPPALRPAAAPAAEAPADKGASATEDGNPASTLPARGTDTEREGLVAREALPIVRGQLEALETRHIAWSGEIWPGQPLEWEIDADDENGRRPGEEPGWRTRFSLALPALGEVEASAALAGSAVRLELAARTPQTAERMRSALPELVQALAGAGIEVVHAKVRCDEPVE